MKSIPTVVRQPKKIYTQLLVLAVAVLIAVSATSARAQTLSVLYNFGFNPNDPQVLSYGVIAQGRDGNLYTTSLSGGNDGAGTVFRITPAGVLTVLYSFDVTHGATPTGLSLGRDGNFYGTTNGGGSGNADGVAFKITPQGSLTVLHEFSEYSSPYAPPVQAKNGYYYGNTSSGGSQNLGSIYKLTGTGTFTTLYSFDLAQGQLPGTPLVQGTDGAFYGVAPLGGTYNWGTIFKMTPSGTFKVLYNFDSTHGNEPRGPLVQGSDGNFYGTTSQGGDYGGGTVYKITPTGQLTFLYSFTGGSDGGYPFTDLIQGMDGNFYGTTQSGGTNYCGTIFRITPSGVLSTLYRFDRTTGCEPAWLFQHTNGLLYGSTYSGGTDTTGCSGSGCGTFYGLDAGLQPFVGLLTTSGKVGAVIEVIGQGFKGATGVSFNGTSANFTVLSDTFMKTTVPTGAATGPVVVSIPSGNLSSKQNFQVVN